MKKQLYTIVFIISIIFGTTSCSDFLEADNKASVEANEYFSTEEGQVALRVTLYNSLKPLVNDTQLSEWGTDLYIATRNADPGSMHQYDIDPTNGSVKSFYTNAYTMVNNANCMLKYATNNAQYIAEAKFVRCFGYYMLTQHFGSVPYITQYIEDAKKDFPRTPLEDIYKNCIAELESIMDDASLPQMSHEGYISQQAVKSLLAKTCLAAGWDLQTTLTDAPQGQYTITATDYFQKAAQYAESVIAGQSLTMSFADKWSPNNEGNEEEIFSVQYERNGYPGDELTGGHYRQNTYGTGYGNPEDNGLKSCGGLAPSPKSIYLWAEGDERYEATFMTTIYNFLPGNWPYMGYYAYYKASTTALQNMVIADRYFPWYAKTADVERYMAAHKEQFVQGDCRATCHVHIIADPATTYFFNDDGSVASANTVRNIDYMEYVKEQKTTASVPCVKKFDDPNTLQNGSSTGYRDIVVYHVSNMYLTAAEANYMAGNEERALQLINAVRARAKATPITSFAAYSPDYERTVGFDIRPIDLILDEMARELYAETTRWIDLRRTKQLVRYNVEFNSYINSIADMSNPRGEVKWYRPIPAAEIETNTAISEADQNPGY